MSLEADVYRPSTWMQLTRTDADCLILCPVCVVPVPPIVADKHVEANHKVTVREAIVHGQPEGIVKDFMLKGSYDEQIAALHARQYWEQDEVERVFGAIYMFQGTGRLSALQSTWDALSYAAMAWRQA